MNQEMCSLCESSNLEKLYAFNTAVELSLRITEWKLNHCLCHNCGVIMVSPPPLKKHLDNYYKGAFPFDYDSRHQRQFAAYEFVKKYTDTKQRTIFDVGAGDGYFLNLFKEDGWECSGVESNQGLIDSAQKNYGLKMHECELEDLFGKAGEPEHDYDVISLSHVLEHLYYPIEAIIRLREMLKQSGYLYIEVPSLEMFAKYEANSEIMAFTHLYHFTSKSLTELVTRHGFTVVQSNTSCYQNAPVIRSLFQRVFPEHSEEQAKIQMTDADIQQARTYFLQHI